jgi:hypothetical protein
MNVDVWYAIGLVVEPMDLLSLARVCHVKRLAPYTLPIITQTCKSIRCAVNGLASWRTLLGDVCFKYGIINGTYPITNASLKEIQQAACRPGLWLRILQRRHGRRPYPTFRNLVPKLGQPFQCPTAYYDTLTPGGRFLIQVVDDENGTVSLKLWDLGVPGLANALLQPTLAAQRASSHPGLISIRATACTTMDSIYILTACKDETSELYTYVTTSPDAGPYSLQIPQCIHLLYHPRHTNHL